MHDDDDLAAALREAIRARAEVPEHLVEAAKSAYAWRTIDAELAELTFDSRTDLVASTRSESASIHALTFTSARLTIEVEVTPTSLIGQVMPAREGTVHARTRDGATTTAPVDEIGCFALEPIPDGPFQLRYRDQRGADVVTSWVSL